nr:MAG TPA: hypothetical protein [Caudoviricetes sp.]
MESAPAPVFFRPFQQRVNPVSVGCRILLEAFNILLPLIQPGFHTVQPAIDRANLLSISRAIASKSFLSNTSSL